MHNTNIVVLALSIAALILAAIEEQKAKGNSPLAWATILLAIAFIVLMFPRG